MGRHASSSTDEVTNVYPFPPFVEQEGRLYCFRSKLETYKAALAGLPPPTSPAIDTLVPAAQAASELGFGRRTLGRRLEEQKAAATETAEAASPEATAA